MSVSMDWLVHQDKLKGIRWIAGTQGGDRQITSVNIIDNPDMLRWLKGGELLLSTGYFLDAGYHLQEEIIQQLHHSGCAGLGIKLKRYLDEVPAAMIRQADDLGLPIVEVPYERSFAEVSRFVYKAIYDSEMSEAERASAVYRELTELLMHNHDIVQVLTTLVSHLRLPIVLTNPYFQLIAYDCPGEDAAPLRELYTLREGEAVFAANLTVQQIKKYDERHFEVGQLPLFYQDRMIDSYVVPIKDNQKLLGFLCIPEIGHACSTADFQLLEAAKPTICLELLRYNLSMQGKQGVQNNFLKAVLYGENLTADELISQCELYGFDYRRKRVCAVIRLEHFLGLPVAQRNSNLDIVRQAIRQAAGREETGYFQLPDNNHVILYYFFPCEKQAKDCVEEALRLCEQLHACLTARHVENQIGVSRCYEQVDTIRQGFAQGLKALNLGVRLHPKQEIYSYDEDFLYHLLSEHVPPADLKELYTDTVEPLAQYDAQNQAELLPTLQAYLEHEQNISLAAQRLYIHRNTMTARMEKIRELLHSHLKDSRENLRLLLGLYAGALLESRA